MTDDEFNKCMKEIHRIHGKLPVYLAEGFGHSPVKSIRVQSNDGIWKDRDGKLLPENYIVISADESR